MGEGVRVKGVRERGGGERVRIGIKRTGGGINQTGT